MTQADSSLLLHCASCNRDRPRGWFRRAGAGRRMSWCRECDKGNRVATAARRRAAGCRPLAKRFLDRMWVRQAGRCGICGGAMRRATAEVDHRVPIAKGGAHVESNLQWTHRACNRAKSSK
jgi:5-methylcytosine-specific restriction endonuclease McrA